MAKDRITSKHTGVLAAALFTLLFLLCRPYWSPKSISPEQTTLRDRLSHFHPYNPQIDLPKNIWQIWLSSPSHKTSEASFYNSHSSWSKLNPDFHHQIITDDTATVLIDELFFEIPEIAEAYEALPDLILKADFLRYLILLARGGVYSDIDTAALKPIENWIPTDLQPYGLIVGIEADPDRPDWRDWYARRIQFCQWTIASKPGHPVLVDIVASIVEETLERKAKDNLRKDLTSDSVMEFTGPGIWTDALFKYWSNAHIASSRSRNVGWEKFTSLKKPVKGGDVVVLPITSFSPGVGHMGAGSTTDPLAYVSHAFSGSWKSDGR